MVGGGAVGVPGGSPGPCDPGTVGPPNGGGGGPVGVLAGEGAMGLVDGDVPKSASRRRETLASRACSLEAPMACSSLGISGSGVANSSSILSGGACPARLSTGSARETSAMSSTRLVLLPIPETRVVLQQFVVVAELPTASRYRSEG